MTTVSSIGPFKYSASFLSIEYRSRKHQRARSSRSHGTEVGRRYHRARPALCTLPWPLATYLSASRPLASFGTWSSASHITPDHQLRWISSTPPRQALTQRVVSLGGHQGRWQDFGTWSSARRTPCTCSSVDRRGAYYSTPQSW